MLHPISSSYKANQSYTTHNANEKKEKRQLYVKKQDTCKDTKSTNEKALHSVLFI